MNHPGVALFGGSFNPIHFGHLIAARAIAEYLDLERVILIP
ncbi:MAG: adenylyltransferase/cytidyltransferase family protein, partial [Phycisphaerae bacterium]|nr:adenylyltransferase/cytidyltransferase family protein [Phycisphaerae bacterium]